LLLDLLSKKGLGWWVSAAIVAAVVVFLLIRFVAALQPVNREAVDVKVEFIIEKGEGLREITAALDRRKLIKSPTAFKIYSFLRGAAHILKPGFYRISPAWSTAQIVRTFVYGPPDTLIVVAEGETLKDVDYKLSQEGIIRTGELVSFDWQILEKDYPFLENIKTLEGFIFPDTYKFSQFSPVEVVARKFLDNFQKNAWPLLSREFANHYASLIVASLIEKEAPFHNDRRVIAGVIYRRLKLKMPLQIDAATAYDKCGQKFFTCDSRTRRLSRDDLLVKGSFNTYLNKGLPPTPIANPGRSAIEAAVSPQSTNYLYYLSNPQTRRTIFSATLDEHNLNRVKYLLNN